MSAVAGNGLDRNREAVAAAMPFPESREAGLMRVRMEAVRDTLIVLGLQVVFRAMMMLRRWNY
jgi:hypothetical protein